MYFDYIHLLPLLLPDPAPFPIHRTSRRLFFNQSNPFCSAQIYLCVWSSTRAWLTCSELLSWEKLTLPAALAGNSASARGWDFKSTYPLREEVWSSWSLEHAHSAHSVTTAPVQLPGLVASSGPYTSLLPLMKLFLILREKGNDTGAPLRPCIL